MGLKDLFKSNEKEEFDPLKDLTLSKLKIGYFLEYDLKTWEVTGYTHYDYGEGYYAKEWELTSGRDKRYLERYEDDDVEWTLSKKIPIGMIEDNIKQYIIENEDPPNKIVCKDVEYYLDENGSAYARETDKYSRVGFIYWDFIDENDENFITVEQYQYFTRCQGEELMGIVEYWA
jgi:hypothetical protein